MALRIKNTPPAPAFMSDTAKDIYKKTVKHLKDAGAKFIDYGTVQRYAMLYDRWIRVQGELDQTGFTYVTENGNPVITPQVYIDKQYTELVNELYGLINKMIPPDKMAEWVV